MRNRPPTTLAALAKHEAGSQPLSKSGQPGAAVWDCSAITSNLSDLNIHLRVNLPVIIVT